MAQRAQRVSAPPEVRRILLVPSKEYRPKRFPELRESHRTKGATSNLCPLRLTQVRPGVFETTGEFRVFPNHPKDESEEFADHFTDKPEDEQLMSENLIYDPFKDDSFLESLEMGSEDFPPEVQIN